MKLPNALLTVTAILICGVVFGGEIKDLHQQQAKPDATRPDQSRGHDEADAKDHGVTEIGLERTPCYGSCAVYTVVIKSDGSLQYTGEMHVRRMGKHTGKVELYEFNQLAQFIKESGYGDFQDRYRRMATDQATVYSTVVIGGKRKVIENYGNAGPSKLWAIEELIDKLLLEATWDEEKPAPQK